MKNIQSEDCFTAKGLPEKVDLYIHSVLMPNDFAVFDKIIHHHCVTAYHAGCKRNLSSTCKVFPATYFDVKESDNAIPFPW